jgi:pimeloyl-ACP methyl ester carboxylesterase
MPPYRVTPDELRQIRVPTLVIRGDSSHPVLRTIAGVVTENVPGAELVELAKCGHVTYAEQPEAFARAVLDFAERLHVLTPEAAALSS